MINNIRFYYLDCVCCTFCVFSLILCPHLSPSDLSHCLNSTFSLVWSACYVLVFCNVLKLWQMHTWTDSFQTNEPTGEGNTHCAKHALPETAALSETLPRPDGFGFHWLIFFFLWVSLQPLQPRFMSAIWFLKSSFSWAGRCVYSIALNLLRKKVSHPVIKFCLK